MDDSSFLDVSNSFSIFLSSSNRALRIASFCLMTGVYQRAIPKTAAASNRKTITRVSLSQMLRLLFNALLNHNHVKNGTEKYVPPRFLQSCCYASAEHLAGVFDDPTRFFERRLCDSRIDRRQLLDNSHGAVAELHVGRIQVDHQITFHFSDSNHRQRR